MFSSLKRSPIMGFVIESGSNQGASGSKENLNSPSSLPHRCLWILFDKFEHKELLHLLSTDTKTQTSNHLIDPATDSSEDVCNCLNTILLFTQFSIACRQNCVCALQTRAPPRMAPHRGLRPLSTAPTYWIYLLRESTIFGLWYQIDIYLYTS